MDLPPQLFDTPLPATRSWEREQREQTGTREEGLREKSPKSEGMKNLYVPVFPCSFKLFFTRVTTYPSASNAPA